VAEHYTKDTTEAEKWCNTCNRRTIHRVSDGRIGACTEHAAQYETKAQKKRREQREKEAREPKLF
jgi:hypothetical protein